MGARRSAERTAQSRSWMGRMCLRRLAPSPKKTSRLGTRRQSALRKRRPGGLRSAVLAVATEVMVLMVAAEFCAAEARVRLAGRSEQVADGAAVTAPQVRATVPAKPFCGVMVRT